MCWWLCLQWWLDALSVKWPLWAWYCFMWMPWWVANFLKAIFACIVLHCKLEKWSTKMVAALYHLHVRLPFNCVIKPTWVLIIWSTDLHSPGAAMMLMGFSLAPFLPCFSSECIKKTSSTFCCVDLGKGLKYFPTFGQLFQCLEAAMPKLIVPLQQFGLKVPLPSNVDPVHCWLRKD